MAFVRHYLMLARPDSADALKAALDVLRTKILPLPGCQGVELYQDMAAQERFHFLERWTSQDAHKAGGAALGKDAFSSVMAALAAPPESASLIAI
ncbi:MAG: antibiotic biosynthesis monooxygenase [Rhodospirillales bacterium]|nr:antibiotic biosynthesis monooxygenase [Rhodospirillales bacterium]